MKDTSFHETKVESLEGNEGYILNGTAFIFKKIPVYPSRQPILQTNLTVNTPGDKYEQEADAMADKIIRMSGNETLQPKISSTNTIHRKCDKCEKEEDEDEKGLQRKESGNGSSPVTNSVNRAIQSPGQPMDTTTRNFMERRFGFDFSKVRIHDDAQANRSAKDINALAYTHQNNIVFGAAQYRPQTGSGKKLLAHELMHTLQQSGSIIQRKDAPEQTASARLIIDDDMSPAEGVMTKSEFLATLNEAVCRTVDEGLAGTPYSSDNCPYIRDIFARHTNSTPEQIEALALRYEPRGGQAKTAIELIGMILLRVKTAVNQWKRRGKLEDVPEDVTAMLAESSTGTAKNTNKTSVQFKAHAGSAHSNQSPQQVMQSLGHGTSIDGKIRSKMESAFEADFSNVQIHTDHHAASLSSQMNARAFTVGEHIAFSSGEYKPGTLIGDALMAHELAHVMQQKGSGLSQENSNTALEEEADNTAVGVVSKIVLGKEIKLPGKHKRGLKTGLRLSRCPGDSEKSNDEKKQLPQEPKKEVPKPPDPKELFKPILDTALSDNQISQSDWGLLRAKAVEVGIDDWDLRRLLSDLDFRIDEDAMAKIILGKEGIYLKLIRVYAPKITQASNIKSLTPNPLDDLVNIVIEDNQIDQEEFKVLRDISSYYGADLSKQSLTKAKFSPPLISQLLGLFDFGYSDMQKLLAMPGLMPMKLNKEPKTGLFTISIDLNDIILKTILADNEIVNYEFDRVRSLVTGLSLDQAAQFFIKAGVEAISAGILAKEFLRPELAYKEWLKRRQSFVFRFKSEGGTFKLSEQTVTNINQQFNAKPVGDLQPIPDRKADTLKSSMETVTAFKFASGASQNAWKMNYSFGGTSFTLIIAESIGIDDGEIFDRVDYALSVIPPKFFTLMKTLVVDPGNRTDVNAAADASTTGTINLYLSGAGKYVDKKILATTIVHEFGHLISFEQQKADSEFWTKWEKAAKQDGLGASRYSFTNHDEDFAETFVLYFSGGNTAGDVRAKYANRFAILDKVISK
jgi:hypothetical protein